MMIGSLPPIGAFNPVAYEPAVSRRTAPSETAETRADARSPAAPNNAAELTEADQKRIRELQQRDREVRAHEMAHIAAGGGLILRGAQYDYETGPDGVRYAVGGDVLIDTSPGRTPEETAEKAQRIIAAALAPSDPSPQDRAVAAKAAQMAAEARIEISLQEREVASAGQEGEEDMSMLGAEGTSAYRREQAVASYSGIFAPGPRLAANINTFA